jgi:acyl-CoA reductase-like NAD-dependent aldehyde dehydrogenase
MSLRKYLVPFLLLVAVSLNSIQVCAQRDHLTTQEADLVREEQQLDRRMGVFIKAIDRRLLAISNPNAETLKEVKKDSEKWGLLPTGTRAELLRDISKIIDEAITNIDDASTRDSQKEFFAKAVRKMAEASTRFISQLRALQTGTDERERETIEEATENLQLIIDSVKKL